MEVVKNALGRDVPVELNGERLRPFSGERKKRERSKLVPSLEEAIRRVGLKSGMTISFHHQLRDGDRVINMVLDTCSRLGIRDLRLAQTALFPVNEPVIEHIKNGVVSRIEGSINGPVGDFLSRNPEALSHPVILRSHGRRGAAIREGELKIDVAFIAASQSDDRGNCNGIWGDSAFGPIVYSLPDSIYADRVVVVSDEIDKYPLDCQDITENRVDVVAQVDSIGDPDKIVSGTTKITDNPMRLKIAEDAVDLVDAVGLVRDGLGFQSGAGGMSLAATKFLGDRLAEKGAVADFAIGGTTKFLFDIFENGNVRRLYFGQAFDRASIDFARTHPMGQGWWVLDIPHYADSTSKGRAVDNLDLVFLGATEVDVDFNVNVNTHSDGRLLHGIGGHQDTADGAFLTIILTPVRRKNNPIIRDRVTTVTTPGFAVDAVVTDRGMAINPRRKDLLEKVSGKDLPLVSIEELRDIAYDETGGPAPLEVDRTSPVALVHWLDGTVLDTVWKVV
ncbi:MAG: citrate lyase subunit alpha [Thermoplasmata archaeon]|nr:citrate lyase subunit alpha [Thermoplasmata archaeon]